MQEWRHSARSPCGLFDVDSADWLTAGLHATKKDGPGASARYGDGGGGGGERASHDSHESHDGLDSGPTQVRRHEALPALRCATALLGGLQKFRERG